MLAQSGRLIEGVEHFTANYNRLIDCQYIATYQRSTVITGASREPSQRVM